MLATAVPVTMLTAWYITSKRTQSTATSPESFQKEWVPAGYHPYELVARRNDARMTTVLTFGLPDSMPTVGLPLPSCVKVKHAVPNDAPNEEFPNSDIVLDKSYSPISLPDQNGYFELLVKGYPPRQGGGLGSYLAFDLDIGKSAMMKMKAPRMIHGDIYRPNRWAKLGFVAGGTGLAPFMQMIRTILADPDDNTEMTLVFSNRHEEDILMRDEIDDLAAKGQIKVHYVLSQPSSEWTGGKGRISRNDIDFLPQPASDVLIMVCGRDGFVDTVSGMTVRGPPKPGQKKGPKVQGPVKGLLKERGYSESMVYKF